MRRQIVFGSGKTKWDLERLKVAPTIYDMLIELYILINGKDSPSYQIAYYEFLDRDAKADLQEQIEKETEAVLQQDISFEKYKGKIVELFENDGTPFIAIHLLLRFDQYFEEREQYPLLGFGSHLSIECQDKMGPLNENIKEYQLFLLQKDSVWNKENYRIQKKVDRMSVFRNIENYIIRDRRHEESLVECYRYKVDLFSRCRELHIGIAPIYKDRWFEYEQEIYKYKKGYFRIYDREEWIEHLNHSYIKILDNMINAGVDIAVFPELAMNSETENVIKRYLMKRSLQEAVHSLKLVFLGSRWYEGNNECILISRNGTVLVRNQKRNAFEYTDKDYVYTEKLLKKPEKEKIIDIQNFGRVWYHICKDGVDDLAQADLWNYLGVNVEVISSYSPSVSTFEERMQSFSVKYLGFGIFANSCEPRRFLERKISPTEVGFVSIPATKGKGSKKTAQMYKEPYGMDSQYCNECKLASCFHGIRLKLDEIAETDENRHIRTEKNIYLWE